MLALVLTATMALAWRRRVRANVLVALAALLLPGHAAAYTVVKTIVWSDGSGRPGAAAFQGTVEGDQLQGIVRIEGIEFRVRGTQRADGTVSGTLYGRDGAAAGTFSAQVAGDELLRGSFNLSGAGGDWATPAQ